MKAIAAKLVKLMGDCGYIQKDGKNTFHRYSYASAANVLEKVNDSCVKHNVASIVNYEIIGEKEKTTKQGAVEQLITVKATLKIIDADSGESIDAVAMGTGQDSGDKAIAKAQTMALKYCWMTTLNISTGDDPEADESVDKRNAETSDAGGKADDDRFRRKVFHDVNEFAKNNLLDEAVVDDAMKKAICQFYKTDSRSKLTPAQWQSISENTDKLLLMILKEMEIPVEEKKILAAKLKGETK